MAERVLAAGVLDSPVLKRGAAALRDAWNSVTVQDGVAFEASTSNPPPFDPHARLFWLVWRAAATTDPDLGHKVFAALPRHASDQADFLLGVIDGGADEVTSRLEALKSTCVTAGMAIGSFYMTVYDQAVWIDIVKAYSSDQVDTSVVDTVRQRHPAFFAMIEDLAQMSAIVEEAVTTWTTHEQANGIYAAIDLIGAFAIAMLEPLTTALSKIWEGVIGVGNDYREAGRLVGAGLVGAVIETWFLCDSLAFGAGAKQLAGLAAKHTAEELFAIGGAHVAELVTTADAATTALPQPVIAAMRRTSYARMPSLRGVGIRQATSDAELYAQIQLVANKIGAHRDVTKVTYAFSRGERALYGHSTTDLQWTIVRLDSHHLLEKGYLKAHALDVAQKLGWKSIDDMDCVALLYEEHILGVPGKTQRQLTPATPSLTERLTAHVDSRNPATLIDVVDAHYEWYLDTKATTLAEQYFGGEQLRSIRAWFDDIYGRLGTVAPPRRPK